MPAESSCGWNHQQEDPQATSHRVCEAQVTSFPESQMSRPELNTSSRCSPGRHRFPHTPQCVACSAPSVGERRVGRPLAPTAPTGCRQGVHCRLPVGRGSRNLLVACVQSHMWRKGWGAGIRFNCLCCGCVRTGEGVGADSSKRGERRAAALVDVLQGPAPLRCLQTLSTASHQHWCCA